MFQKKKNCFRTWRSKRGGGTKGRGKSVPPKPSGPDLFNPVSPNGDQHQFSPKHIHTLSRDNVMRINKMIIKEKMLWSFIKFSQLILEGNIWRSVWRICSWILGLKGLRQKSFISLPYLKQETSYSCRFANRIKQFFKPRPWNQIFWKNIVRNANEDHAAHR